MKKHMIWGILSKWKDNSWRGRKYLQSFIYSGIACTIYKELSELKKKIINDPIKNVQNIWMTIYLKKIYK